MEELRAVLDALVEESVSVGDRVEGEGGAMCERVGVACSRVMDGVVGAEECASKRVR